MLIIEAFKENLISKRLRLFSISIGVFIFPILLPSSAYAVCLFSPGPAATAGDDTVTCDNSGSDPAGLATLAGNDTVTIDIGAAINGELSVGEGSSNITNSGLIDSSAAAIESLGNTVFNNTSSGVINFGNVGPGSNSGINFFGLNTTPANVLIDNSGMITADDGSDNQGAIRVTGYTTGVIDINNHTGAFLSSGQPGGSTLTGTGHEFAGIAVGNVGASIVTIVNDGTLSVSTDSTFGTMNNNVYGVLGIGLVGDSITNNGTIDVAASNEETNMFAIMSNGGTNTQLNNTGSILVTTPATYVGFPADETAEVIGMVSLISQGSLNTTNALGATIDVVGDATGTEISFVGMAQAVCTDGSGCLGSSIVNAGDINIAVNDGVGAVGAGMFSVEGFVDQVINNSGAITVVNNAPNAEFMVGLNMSSIISPNVVNSGTFSIQNVADSGASLGALINDTADYSFNNTPAGSILVTGSFSFGIVSVQSGSASSLVTPNLTNAGTMTAATGVIINGSPAVNGNINSYILNTGTLTGSGGIAIDAVTNLGFSPVPLGATVETVNNTGTINGDVLLGLGDDTVIQTVASAAIIGDVDMGDGADVVQLQEGAISTIQGGDGDDVLEWVAGTVTSIGAGNGTDTLIVDASAYDGTQALDGGDDTASADGWVDTLTLRGLSAQITSSNVSNWENIIVDGSALTSTDYQLGVGADPGTGLMFSNGGSLDLRNGAPTNAFTLTGNFNGGGVLYLDTALGDSGSASDTLAILNDAGGVTTVTVANIGGLGSATTGDGILLIEVTGSSSPGAFLLAGGEVRAGNYVYQLVQVSGQNWFLQSSFELVSPPINPNPLAPIFAVPTVNKYGLMLLALLIFFVSSRDRLLRH